MVFLFKRWFILTSCLIGLIVQGDASQEILIKQNGFTKPLFQDSIPVISGKIVDSATNNPIPFVRMTFFKDSIGVLNIVSDKNGRFLVNQKNLRPKVMLSAIGYQQRIYNLSFRENNTLLLAPESNALPDVIITSQVNKNADWIIKKVSKNIGRNFGDISFDQIFKKHSLERNYDSLKVETSDSVVFNFDASQLPSPIFVHRKHSDTTTYDAAFFYHTGVSELSDYSFLFIDMIRMSKILDEKKNRKF